MLKKNPIIEVRNAEIALWEKFSLPEFDFKVLFAP
jgi:hypothetical protein